jgi:CheY-like chemotaxis protein
MRELRDDVPVFMIQGQQPNPTASEDNAADILLVEDDPDDAEFILRALRTCGRALRVEHVTDGVEALDYIACARTSAQQQTQTLPRLILLDLRLSRMQGMHVLRVLKSDERTQRIPIVVLTASRLNIELMESYKLGVNSYVIKPADAKKFQEVVATLAHYWLGVNEPALPARG